MLSPIIFRIGNIQVTYYALVYIIGFLLALFVLLKNKKKLGLKEEQTYDLMILLIIGILIGARLFHILFWSWSYFSANPQDIIKIWEGGLSFHGGLLGAFLAVFFYSKRKNLDFWKLADTLIIPAALMLVFGRFANLINQEIVGTVTSASWCLTFQGYEGCRHPIQIYAAAGRFLLFLALIGIKNKLKEFKPGLLFWTFVFLISIGRFVLDFIREDTTYLALSAGQWLSIPLIFASVYVILKHYRGGLQERPLSANKTIINKFTFREK